MSKKKQKKPQGQAALLSEPYLQQAVNAVAEQKAAEMVAKDKKKKYERQVRMRFAGDVAKFLIHSGKNFRGRYESKAIYTFRVDEEDKPFLNDFLAKMEHDKK